ncbi:LCP family protein [Streptomyces sp. WMMC897]|uniref:LCP family protein n=1 Tax=Streptomyces sp. WMMC897 TaxID=3014782 RepID=UPI0022B6A966|nr:LCP family protein [Streptomyces sp. WMMC897]MCZ7414605.1 LCP family protein [Streptomyces sp. WMMC897]
MDAVTNDDDAGGPRPEPGRGDDPAPAERPRTGEPGTEPRGEPDAASDGEAADAPAPRSRRRRWLRWAAAGGAFVVLAATGIGAALYLRFEDNITTDTRTAEILKRYDKERPVPEVHDAQNVLLIGSDSREGDNRRYGEDDGQARSDTAILLHLSADRESATAVSLPRDLMVTVPRCVDRREGEESREQFAQFNWAYEFGGASCTIRTVEELTGIRVDHHLVIDFQGFKKLVNSVDGVEVCLPKPVVDRDAKLRLPAGRQTLRGEEALGYVRARHALGDGSDTERMERQQDFLASLFRKVRSTGVLMNPAKLVPVLDAATSSLTADEGLNSLTELYELVRGLRELPEEGLVFLTVPRQPYSQDPNRDELVQPEADRLFTLIRKDRPVDVVQRSEDAEDRQEADGARGERGTGDDDGPSEPTPTPTYSGATAEHAPCD